MATRAKGNVMRKKLEMLAVSIAGMRFISERAKGKENHKVIVDLQRNAMGEVMAAGETIADDIMKLAAAGLIHAETTGGKLHEVTGVDFTKDKIILKLS